MELFFITGNQIKVQEAQKYCEGITFIQQKIELQEIQNSDIAAIALDKAQKAFEITKKPLVVSDNGWLIPAIKGFPGPFMKYINQWFEPQDFLNLMLYKTDRTIIARDVIVYMDKHGHHVIQRDMSGKILYTPKGASGHSLDKVISFSPSGKSIAEFKDEGGFGFDDTENAWHLLSQWVKTESFQNRFSR